MRFKGLDLNLLVALEALITEKSVSNAATRLGVTQSAMSSALGRLRAYFGDNLFVNVGRRMVLTPRGEALAGPVHDALLQIGALVSTAPEFDPKGSNRCFNILASNFMTAVVLGRALPKACQVAPNVTFVIHALEDNAHARLERAEVDLLITTEQYVSRDHPYLVLFEEDHLLLGWRENPAFRSEIDIAAYSALRHVAVSHGKGRLPSFETVFVEREGPPRIVDVVVPAFTDVGAFLVGTHLVSTVHRRLARAMCEQLPLVARELPFRVPPIRLCAQWHHISRNDPELRWLLELIQLECDLTGGEPFHTAVDGKAAA